MHLLSKILGHLLFLSANFVCCIAKLSQLKGVYFKILHFTEKEFKFFSENSSWNSENVDPDQTALL